MTTTQAADHERNSPLSARRATKFTPERLQQILNLVERGKSRDEIADILDVTVGSLQVTCSRLGISLKRPKIDNGVGLLRKCTPGLGAPLRPAEEHVYGNSQAEPGKPAVIPRPEEQRGTISDACAAKCAISIQYRGMKQTHELSVTAHTIGLMALEATLRAVSIGELMAEIIRAITDKDLFQRVLGDIDPSS